MRTKVKIGLLMVLLAASFSYARADERIFHCEFGIEGGCGYYMGDAANLPFQNVREMYGANFRYRFDQRWSIQAQGITHRIMGDYPKSGTQIVEGKWTNQLVNIDAAAEFNFFRFGSRVYDQRVKPITPYIMLGIGVGASLKNIRQIYAYIPFGVGVKWKFAKRMNLQLLWQNNIYFTDNLEGIESLNNTYNLNGSNLLNRDMTGTISLGLTFEFAQEKKICRLCKN